MEALLVSTGVVALGEMGDKTQLLAIILAATFRKPWQIVAGIFTATVVNHAAAGALGGWVAQAMGPNILRWVIGASFLAMAAWMLIPDKIDDDAAKTKSRFGAFGTTVITFFLAEMGDKTQIATVALAARYPDVVQVVIGTTLGMMLADAPAVFLGEKIAAKVSMRLVHGVAAVIFGVLGLLTLFNVGNLF
ncbi:MULTISPECIES: TMEM165/GDT1 family protein [Burkholderiales]|jgi:putative Ca2+/H+ antiporter (TMEM165/GDT1 family)|uniref:TMEM165/GDT1 family protein n=1 Tax=Burkholderiales TaxID=80840 RepID=UPI0008EBA213|nr:MULTISPECIES: TMEM165/GDT1 family protein [Burkholderiales]MCW0205850.1 TMEM165/GDT1 family protein [Achromobacter sp.]TAJ64560.1 MAG: TMEM165/GDT1 family protein [Variovorax sp.]SFO82951.1 Putative Ca2+/H+ antiporter, TMEM165/GDT1 family [Variovorax sp. PDC80]